MKKSPEERFGTAGEVVEALRPLAKASTTRTPSRPLPGRESPPAKTNPQAAPEGLMSLPKPGSPKSGPAKSASSPKAPASVSTPTPKPPGLGALPTRSSLKGAGNPPATPPKSEPKPVRAEVVDEKGDRVVPGAPANADEPSFWEERLGPVGISMAVVGACMVIYIVGLWLGVF